MLTGKRAFRNATAAETLNGTANPKIETLTSLKGLHRATGLAGNTEISVAPDGSAVFTRDIGTQWIYALTVKWP